MTKNELNRRTNSAYNQTADALNLVFSLLNRGQQKQLLKNQQVKEILDRYGIEYQE